MPWWETEQYTDGEPIPKEMESFAGPHGIATVRAFDNGKTDPGWGMNPDKYGRTFVDTYPSGRFNTQIAKVGWVSGRWNFAFVMRSMSLICIDIDGKNGGLQNVGRLGMLPPTLAETSKSGNGYHLFYSTPWDVWDEKKGFAAFKDRIGLFDGIDLRAVGCVYHHPGQAWNDRKIAELPQHLRNTWEIREQKAAADVQTIIDLLDSGTDEEVLMMHEELKRDLARTIPVGKRNTTLYAIGVQMLSAGMPDWESLVMKRAFDLGLDHDEIMKLVANIKRYR